VLRILEAWGYVDVDSWELTDAGRLLTRLYTETDLLVAESVREGLLDGLTAAELAAVVSCFAYERRGPEGVRTLAPAKWPAAVVAERVRGVERIWRDLSQSEDDAGLPETRGPDGGFTPYLYEWVAGDDLGDVLTEDDDMTGGDFVRNVKQCVDLLHQIADVAPDPATVAAARDAAAGCLRGVVAASSVAPR
jgi:ATP-dependent RNA helicase HelY